MPYEYIVMEEEEEEERKMKKIKENVSNSWF